MTEIAALGLRIDGVEGVDKAATSLNRLKDSSRDAGASSAKLGVESKASSKSINELANQSNKASSSVSALAGAAKAAGGVLIAAFSVAKLAGYADTWSDLQSRVGAATGSMEGAAGQMDRLLKIANASYSPLAQTAEIYSRNVSTFKDLGRSASEAADFTESLNHMLVLTATRGQRAESVQNALSKAMAVGKLQADGLETVLANGGEVAQALAMELGTTVSGLREMASQGKITSDVIATSIVKSLEDVRKRADEMPATIGDAFARIGNNVTALVGQFDKVTGASGKFAAKVVELADYALEVGTEAIKLFAENIDTIASTIVLATKLVAAYVVAVYAIPTTKALASAATAAYTGVLRIFSAQVAMTTRQLLSMRTALNVVAAAFAGWEIGTYLRKEFEIVEKAGIALMAGLHMVAVRIAGEFRIMGENIKFYISNPIDAARGYIVDFFQWLDGLGGETLKFLGLDGLIAGTEKDWDKLRGATATQHKATITQLRTELKTEIAGISDVYAEMFAEVGSRAGEASAGVENDSKKLAEAAGGVADGINAVNDALADLGSSNDAVAKEITALERAAIVWGMAADEVKLYDLRVMGATDAQLAYAKSLLDTVEGFEQQKEKQDNYLRLVQDLRTDEERLTDQLRERLAVLDAINGASQQDYSRAAAAAMQEAPKYGGLAPEVGGPLGELNKIDEAQEKLQEWYSTQLSMLEQFRAERSDLSAQWDEQELALKQEHENQIEQIERARQQARMAAGEEFFGNMSSVAKAFFGENSKLYKAAFLVEKAYAINKALINAPKAYSDAYTATVGIPYVGPVLAPAAGAVAAAAQVAQASAIGSINMPSFDGGGYTGDGARAGGLDGKGGFLAMMHPRETVTDHTKGQSVGGNVVVNINEDASRAGQVNETQQDDQRVIDIFVSNIMGDGQAASVIQNKFGLTAQGR